MTIEIFGFGRSRSFRTLWAAIEADLDFNYTNLDFGSTDDGGSHSDGYRKLNTQSKVPTLTDGEFVLTESGAILNYIDALTSEPFIPTSAQGRARYDQMSFFIISELEQPLWTIGKHKFALPEEHRVAEIFATAKWEFEKAKKALLSIVSIEEYALAGRFTFADVLLAHTLNWAANFEMTLSDDMLAYRDRMYQRDAVQKALSMIG